MALDTETLLDTLREEIAQADSAALNDLRVRYLGKKGLITTELKTLGGLAMAQRREAGEKLNRLRAEVTALIEARLATLEREAIERRLQDEQIDVSLPGRAPFRGGLHPLTLALRRIRRFFAHAGFTEVAGPEIEDEYHNFTALNIPDDHPARAMHDTFYFGDGRLLRTHTSPVQIRAMDEVSPPLRIIAPGRVYRCDADATHSPMFHQVEGLFVDRHVSFANLKHILHRFLQAFFDDSDLNIRFRPSYFPFTEPSAEVDIRRRSRTAGQEDDWLEVMGCGLVHPKVLEAVGYNSSVYSAYAFGLGVERLAMLRYGVADLRQFFVNDVQFLKQFEGAS